MGDIVRLVGPNSALEIFGIRLVGVNADTGKKILFSILLILVVYWLARLIRFLSQRLVARDHHEQRRFWARQIVHISAAILLILGLLSIWFDDPTRLATALGLVTAGLAFALQRVVTALAGYFVALRGKVFNVGDRIVMGGVRGDVIALDFIQTTVMEMGQPAPVQEADPAMWIRGRQYTGRIVTITNDKIFDMPVYNFSRDFPYIWEELALAIPYSADRRLAERIILEAARRHTIPIKEMSEENLHELERRYFVKQSELEPAVFLRLTDNWIEMSVRFIVQEHGIRAVKDAMSRDILDAFDRAGIQIASATFEVTGLPKLNVEVAEHAGRR